MKTPTIAAQLYTLRDFTKTPEDLDKTFKKVKEIGYNAVQVSCIGPIDDQFVKDTADKYGLTICATHIKFDRLKTDMDNVIKQHKLWNCKYVGIGSMPGEYRKDAESFKKFAKEASKYGKVLLDNGLQLIYHNHAFEFQKFNGKTGMDILLEECDPKSFSFELDTYWIQTGGANPVDYIRKMKNYIHVIHLKDMVGGPDSKSVMAEIGEGNLDWNEIMKACNDANVEWCAVEQDICQRSPFESLAISQKYLQSIGCNF